MENKDQITTHENMNQLKTDKKPVFDMTPRTFEEGWRFAEMAAQSDMVPKDFKNKPGNCIIAMQMGSELGIPPLQALQNIAVVNGRPAVWGDLLPALAQAHPHYEFMNETFDDETMTATCVIKRRNQPEQTRTFSQKDATVAGLWGRNTWKNYPKRMLQMRARGFAVRDVFPDALKGCSVAEDIIDLDPKDYSVVGSETIPKSGSPALITEDQEIELSAYIQENKLDANIFLKLAKINSLSELPSNKFEKAKEVLQAQVLNNQGETK